MKMKSISLCETNHGDQGERNKESNRKTTANGSEGCERGATDEDDMPDIEICEVIEKSTSENKSMVQTKKKSPNTTKNHKKLNEDGEFARSNRKDVIKDFADRAMKIFGDKSENDSFKHRERNYSEISSTVKTLEPEIQFKNIDILIDIEKNFKEGNNCDIETDFSDLSNSSVRLSELTQSEEASGYRNGVKEIRKKAEKGSDRNGSELKSDLKISNVNSSMDVSNNGAITKNGDEKNMKIWDVEKINRDQGESYFTEEIFIEDEEEEEEENKENMRDCEDVEISVSHPIKADSITGKEVESCVNGNIVSDSITSDWNAEKPEWYIDKAGDLAMGEHNGVIRREGSFTEDGLILDEASDTDCEKNLGRIEDVQGNACVNFEEGKDVENEVAMNEREGTEGNIEISVVDDEDNGELEEQQFQKRKRLSNTEETIEISMKKRKVDGAEKRVNKCNNSPSDYAIQEINVISTRKISQSSNADQEREEGLKKLYSSSNSNNINNNNINNSNNNNNDSKSKSKEQSKESISNLDKTINKVATGKCPLPFIEKLKGNIKTLSRKDLEELIVQKLCEVVTERSTIGQLRRKAAALEQDQERWKERVQSLTKQIKEMELIMKKYMNDVQKYHKDKNSNVSPLRITRSVGLQVSFTPTNSKAAKNAPIGTQTVNQLVPNAESGTSKLSPQTVNTSISTKKFVSIATVPSKVNCESKVASTSRSYVNVAVQNRLVSPPQNGQVRTLIAGNRVVQTQQDNVRPKAPAPIQNSSKIIDLTEDDDKQNSENSQKPLFPTGVNVKNSGQIRVVNHLQPAQVNSNGRVAYLFPATTATVCSSTGSTQSRQVLIATPTVHQPNRQMLPSVPPLLYKGSTLLQPAVTQSTFINHSSRVAIVKPLKHPAPLPQPPSNQAHKPNWKLLPPRPALKISKVQTGIVLSWNMTLGPEYEPIASYQLYAYQESNLPPETSLWKKVGDVKALPLPMACTLTQFMTGHRYHFAVRAVDLHSRIGPFSFPGTIVLVK